MTEIRILTTLDSLDPAAWNACFSGELEDHAYLHAFEKSEPQGFAFRYVTAWDGAGLVAAVPAFLTEYALDTTLDGAGKKFTRAVRARFPKAMTLRLACLGSPVTEYGAVGFHPRAAQKERLLSDMLAAFEAHAADAGHGLVGIKDVPLHDDALWKAAAGSRGYCKLAGLPVASLAIDFSSIEEYMGRLSRVTRKNMRRKLRAAGDIRIERRNDIEDAMDDVMKLYRDTRGRAEMQFEELTPEFFRRVLRRPSNGASCTLYFTQDTLLAANLLLHDDRTLLDKYFCMDGKKGRDFNLYFLSWFTNIRYCLDHGMTSYQSGHAAYADKLRLGCGLTSTAMYFRHRHPFVHGALRLIAPLLAIDDPSAREAA